MKIRQENFQVDYWAGDNNFLYKSQKPKRTTKKKLFIVLSFISMLAITPLLIYGISSIDINTKDKVSVINSPLVDTDSIDKVISENNSNNDEVIVLKNDNYWKITKRTCGKGNFYLSVKDQNDSKALFEGDTVKVNCSL